MNRLKAVFWDMDGTLVDSEAIAVNAFSLAMAEAGLPHLPDLHDLVVGRAADDLYRWLVKEYGLTLPPVEWEQRKHFHHLGAAERIKGFSQAIAVFRALEAAGIPQAIVSNSDRLIMDVQLQLAGLAQARRTTISRNDVRRGKPDPEGYLRASWLLETNPTDCLVVEDSRSGAAAGRAAGMTTVFVPHATVPPPAQVRQLSKMQDVMGLVGVAFQQIE